jgi:hypothetical protein
MFVPYSPTYGGTGLQVRFGNYDAGNVWTAWKTLLASDNYNSYAPTLTGSGASGTWGINVTGNAGTAYGLAVHAGRNNEANKVVRTDGSGYIQAGWINTDSGDNGTTAISRVYASQDGYIRYYTPANFRQVLDVPTRTGGDASGSWGISVTGSSGSCSGNAATATTASNSNALFGYGTNNVVYGTNGAATFDGLSSMNDATQRSGFYLYNNPTGAPDATWTNWLTCNGHYSGDRYGFQFSQSYWSNNMYVRGWNSNTFRPWRLLLDSLNYNSYSPTLTGGGASGTWGISITGGTSGNAATATRATAGSNFYIDNNYGYGIVGLYNSTIFQGVFAMGDSYKLTAGGGINNLYGIAWSHPNAGGIAGNLDSHGLIVAINGGFGSCMAYSIKASSNVTAYSDERLKKDWADLPKDYVEQLAKVKVGTYTRIDGEKLRQVGVSAQSLKPLLPEAVIEATDDFKTLSVAYGNAAMASAVELAKEVVSLKEQLAAVLERLNKLENK